MNSNMDLSKENDDQYPTTEVGKGDEIIFHNNYYVIGQTKTTTKVYVQ